LSGIYQKTYRSLIALTTGMVVSIMSLALLARLGGVSAYEVDAPIEKAVPRVNFFGAPAMAATAALANH
jgi:hypothetical protein